MVSGQVLQGTAGYHSLTAEEIENGQVLFCQAKPITDVEIEPRQIEMTEPNARRQLNARVMRIDFLTSDVARLKLRFPVGEKVKFKAGQYLKVLLPDGQRRSFSMANPPHQNDGAELHIRLLDGGAFSQWLTQDIKLGDELSVDLPYGDFHLREESDAPIVMLASGTGFAPIKSMVEDWLRKGKQRDISLYWGARTEKDLYLLDHARDWSKQESLRFVPVLSEPDDGWTGRIGLVHQAVMKDHVSLSGHQVYACGAPAMVSAARNEFFLTRGLLPDAFFYDAFVTAQPRTSALSS
jgi:NAD(P)H-flavin reductase